jgi:hypothetical protein
MTKIFLAIFISLILLTSCSTSKKVFGQNLIENNADTSLSKQAILKIRSLVDIPGQNGPPIPGESEPVIPGESGPLKRCF